LEILDSLLQEEKCYFYISFHTGHLYNLLEAAGKGVSGMGRLMGFLYTLYDKSFEQNWKIAK